MLDIAQILSVGSIGLGFLLAYLASLLLRKDNIRERPLYIFMIFCIVLISIGSYVQIATYEARRDAIELSEQLKTVRYDLAKATDNLSEILKLFSSTRENLQTTTDRTRSAEAKFQAAVQAMTAFVGSAPAVVSNLNRVSGFLGSAACPGGSNGRAIPNGAQTGGLATEAVSRISSAQGEMTRVLALQ